MSNFLIKLTIPFSKILRLSVSGHKLKSPHNILGQLCLSKNAFALRDCSILSGISLLCDLVAKSNRPCMLAIKNSLPPKPHLIYCKFLHNDAGSSLDKPIFGGLSNENFTIVF